MPRYDALFWMTLGVLFMPGLLLGQNDVADSPDLLPGLLEDESVALADEASRDRLAESLASLYQAIEIKQAEYDRLNAALQEEETELGRTAVLESMEDSARELRQLRRRFQETAAGVDLSLFEEAEKAAFSWEEKLGNILEPIFSEIESATVESRRISELRQEVAFFTQQKEAAQEAMANIEIWRERAESEGLREVYDTLLRRWREREQLAANQANASRLRLEDLESRERGLIDGSTAFVRGFVQQRGFNLFLGIMAGLAVFFAVRLILYVVRRMGASGNPKKLGSRIFVLGANLASVLGALLAMLVVFSATGDLFLLAIVVLFLLGASWAGIKVIPQFVESLKIILNIGMVKENERLVFDEIPWNVDTLGFQIKLTNEWLDNGVQIMPVRHLVGLHSRPWCEGEELFPCRRGDWVQLSDDSSGKVLAQNPGHVILQEYGGARRTYQTGEFLALHPRRLSDGLFRVTTRFGIDYQHQAECTTRVPELMEKTLREQLPQWVEAPAIQEVSVRFAEAGASSLDYHVEAVLDGSAAGEYERLQFALQQILVDLCNAQNWTIPFQQITLHRA